MDVDVTKYYLVKFVKEDEDEGTEATPEIVAGPFTSEDEAESNMINYQSEGVLVQKGTDLQQFEQHKAEESSKKKKK